MQKPPTPLQRFLARYWPVLLITAIWLGMFWPMMTGQTVVAFRDSAYLYYPLFKWIDSVWAAGEIPLWNPYDNYGAPVVADGSTSVFYPGKLIIGARFLSYEARYGIYLAIHVWIASMGGYWFARKLCCSRAGATLAGFSYAFGGSVLFQVTNVIYLVSAAWLPFALCCVWQLQKTNRGFWAAAIGVFCSLMILGGDPQMAYHVGLIAAATLLFAGVRVRRQKHKSGERLRPLNGIAGGLIRLGIVVGVTFVLSAIQLLPSMEHAKFSERAAFNKPRNIYEVITVVSDGRSGTQQARRGLLETPRPDEHLHHVYQFSQPPWSIAELLWPNVSGKPFPAHQRWAAALPGADRMWTPSLYVGCLTFLLSLPALRLLGKRRKQVWVTRWTFFFGIASFGWYGVVWLIREIIGDPSQFGVTANHVGGLYWLMVVALPKYVMFRYPAKLFVIASLGICMLAGIKSTDIGRSSVWGSLKWVAVSFVGGLVLTGLAAGYLSTDSVKSFLEKVPADSIWGPFQRSQSVACLYLAFVHTAICVLAFAVWATFIRRFPNRSYMELLLVLVVFVDLVTANHHLTSEIESNNFRNVVTKRDIQDHVPRFPLEWATETSYGRLGEVVEWQQEVAFPKWHLSIPERHLGSFSSIRSTRDIAANFIVNSIYTEPELGNSLRFNLSFDTRGLHPEHSRLGRFNRSFMQVFEFDWHEIKGTPAKIGNKLNIIEESPTRLRYAIHAEVDDLYLCLKNLWDENWKARVIAQEEPSREMDAKVEPWMYVFSAVKVPAGKHIVELVYRPQSFYRGAAISSVGWALLLVIVWVQRPRRKK